MLDIFSKIPNLKNAKRAENYFWKGMEYLNNDKRGLAVQEFENALKIDADTILPLMEEQFSTCYKNSRILEALTIGSFLKLQKKDDFRLMNHLGNLHRKLGELKKANEYYKKAIGLNRQYNNPLYNLAAGLAGVSLYDDALKELIKKHISLGVLLFPKSTYPRDQRIISHLAEVLNMKAFFGKVERLQELIFKKTLMQEEPDLKKMEILVERIKVKYDQRIEHDSHHPNVPRLLGEVLKLDWSKLAAGEKDSFLWDVLNLGLYIFRENSVIKSTNAKDGFGSSENTDLQMAIDCFMKLKVEHYSWKYLDMVVGLRHTVEGDSKQSIAELKTILKNDPNDRYVNINLGLLYRQVGNRLLSLVHLLKGAGVIEELGGVCHLNDIIDKAGQYYGGGDLKRALKLYNIASLETDSIEILEKIGEILMSLHRYYEAIQPFKEIIRIEPESKSAREKLVEIQDHFCFLAEEFYNAGEFIKASEHYEKALEIDRSAAIVRKTMKAYKMQGDHKQEFVMQEEYQKLLLIEKEKDQSVLRQSHMATAIKYMKAEDFQKAIEQFKIAFRMRMDKDAFMYLSYLYKKFNQKRALQELMTQWNAIMSPKD
ncbi:tetratricopeptide repeat protein [bacterium]|nr:tetratricopeptide repeat protein [bacterium]